MTVHRDSQLGLEFQHLRETLALKQHEAAHWLGISASVLAGIERGEPCLSTDLRTCERIVRDYAVLSGIRPAPLLKWLSEHFAENMRRSRLDPWDEREPEQSQRPSEALEPVFAADSNRADGDLPQQRTMTSKPDGLPNDTFAVPHGDDEPAAEDDHEPLNLLACWAIGRSGSKVGAGAEECLVELRIGPGRAADPHKAGVTSQRPHGADGPLTGSGRGDPNYGTDGARDAGAHPDRPWHTDQNDPAQRDEAIGGPARQERQRPVMPSANDYTWFEYGPRGVDLAPYYPPRSASQQSIPEAEHAYAVAHVGGRHDAGVEALPRFIQHWDTSLRGTNRSPHPQLLSITVSSRILSMSTWVNLWRN